VRRAFTLALILIIGVFARLPAVPAQPVSKTARVGFFYFGARQPGPGAERYATFLEGMHELGYVEGKNLIVEARFAESRPERLPEIMDELLRQKVDVIVATGSPVYRVLQRMTTPVPIVVTVTADPVLEGLAATVAHPGGNFTGLSDTAADLSLKQLELLKDIIPKLSRVGVLLNPDNVSHPAQTTRLVLAGQKFGVQVVLAEASTTAQIESGFATFARERSHVVMLFGDTFFAQQLPEIARAALKHRLPSTYIVRQYVDAGGLMSYGAPIIENFRRAATYVDKIFKGATPAQLPFEQPTNYELAINLKTARALGLTIPQSIRLRANDLVE